MGNPPHQYYRPHRMFLVMETATPPVGLNSKVGDGNVHNNMVIILAALLFALICALGLNSAIRCALRCGYSFGFGTPVQTPALRRLDSRSTGLKKGELNRIPVVPYESGINISGTDCSICLAEFVNREKLRILPKCSHGFHVKCIDTWLLSSSSCPLCRQELLDITKSWNAEEANSIVRLPENEESSTVR